MSTRHQRILAAFTLVGCIAVVVVLSRVLGSRATTPTRPSAPEEVHASETLAVMIENEVTVSACSLDQVAKVVTSLRPKTAAYLVQFSTDYTHPRTGPDGRPVPREPITGMHGWDPDTMRVHGRFRLVKTLAEGRVSWGEIHEDRVSCGGISQHVGGQSPKYLSLKPLVQASKIEKAIVLYAWCDASNSDPLACQFIGPLSAGDMRSVEVVAKTIDKTPFNRISVESAKEMLQSGDRWLRTLALVRLDDLRQTTVDHLATTLAASSTVEDMEYSAGVFFNEKWRLFDERVTDRWVRVTLGKSLAPFQQRVLLKQLLWRLESKQIDGVYFEQLKLALRGYEKDIANDAQRTEVLELVRKCNMVMATK